jgi:hypothetical protein
MNKIIKRVLYTKSQPVRHGFSAYIQPGFSLAAEIYERILCSVLIRIQRSVVGKITDKTTHLICDPYVRPVVGKHINVIHLRLDIYELHVYNFTFFSPKSKIHRVWNAETTKWMIKEYPEEVYLIATCTVNTRDLYAIDTSNGPVIQFYYGNPTISYSRDDGMVSYNAFYSSDIVKPECIVKVPNAAFHSFVGGMAEYFPVVELDPDIEYRNDMAEAVIRALGGFHL